MTKINQYSSDVVFKSYKTYIYIIICLLSINVLKGQDSLNIKSHVNKNSISCILGGETLGAAVAYERMLQSEKTLKPYLGIGIGYSFFADEGFCLPAYIGCSFGRKRNFAYAEAGILNFFIDQPYPSTKAERIAFKNYHTGDLNDKYRAPYNAWPAINAGYKFVGKKGFLLKLGASGIIYRQNKYVSGYKFFALPKVSLGYAF